MELVFDLGGDKQYSAGGNFCVFISSLEMCSTTDYVVHFIFMMRTLWIGSSSRENVQAGAQSGHAQEFPVSLSALRAGLVNVVDLAEPGFGERVQARIPPKTRSVNWGTRLCACRFPSGLYHW